MGLMERVATLLRANVNDLIDRAEDPEKMLKQLLTDMENQLLQVKTQVAIAIADQHLLEKKATEQHEKAEGWRRKAELAVEKNEDDLARLALERALSHDSMAEAFARQVNEQAAEADALRTTYNKLQQKLTETQGQCELLVAEHRRARMIGKANEAQQKVVGVTVGSVARGTAMSRMKNRIGNAEAENYAGKQMLAGETLEDRFSKLERDEKIERLLDDLKQKQGRMLEAG
ncbi:MAG TPA: PspA/IM30 family protein [Acidobacteriaceae bacterium]|nr:PspA/IM30 family protein [Acidobacteriaceae bacterium]